MKHLAKSLSAKAQSLYDEIVNDIVSTVSTIESERESAKQRVNSCAVIWNLFQSEKHKSKYSYKIYSEIFNYLNTKK